MTKIDHVLCVFTGKYPRLLPSDKSSEMYRKVQEFTEAFSKLNIPVFCYGTFHDEELRKGVRLPQMVLRARLQGENDGPRFGFGVARGVVR